MGVPLSRDQYIHRLGRTGRGGKEGQGMLILAPWEEYFLDDLKDIPLENFTLPHLDANAKLKVKSASSLSLTLVLYPGYLVRKKSCQMSNQTGIRSSKVEQNYEEDMFICTF